MAVTTATTAAPGRHRGRGDRQRVRRAAARRDRHHDVGCRSGRGRPGRPPRRPGRPRRRSCPAAPPAIRPSTCSRPARTCPGSSAASAIASRPDVPAPTSTSRPPARIRRATRSAAAAPPGRPGSGRPGRPAPRPASSRSTTASVGSRSRSGRSSAGFIGCSPDAHWVLIGSRPVPRRRPGAAAARRRG